MKVTVATLSDSVFTLDVGEDLEIENFKVSLVLVSFIFLYRGSFEKDFDNKSNIYVKNISVRTN